MIAMNGSVRAWMITKGLLTFVLPQWAYGRPYVPADPAKHYYSVFLKHLTGA